MHYGIQIKLDDGTDLVTAITPTFILDYLSSVKGRTKSYPVPEGLTLKVMDTTMKDTGTRPQALYAENIIISGNTVTFPDSDLYPLGSDIVVYME
ncbi:hypothetical protein [Candidatus Regiella endosymbiont of Tuberolachnus salignus]|uniref:hypothetical protein n=1 Tax=Candidatus Regiella endosymbiont of Tuberolachnus salignus TaxID=3077956 RepID=UPI0030CB90BF